MNLLNRLNNEPLLVQASIILYESSGGNGTCGVHATPLAVLPSNHNEIIGAWTTLSTPWKIVLFVINLLHCILMPISWFVTLVYWAILSSTANDLLAFV
jgi:hypothetical protein